MNVFQLDPEKFQQWGDSFIGRQLMVGDPVQDFPIKYYNTHRCEIVRWAWPHKEVGPRWTGRNGIWLYCIHGQGTWRKTPIKVLIEERIRRRKRS